MKILVVLTSFVALTSAVGPGNFGGGGHGGGGFPAGGIGLGGSSGGYSVGGPVLNGYQGQGGGNLGYSGPNAFSGGNQGGGFGGGYSNNGAGTGGGGGDGGFGGGGQVRKFVSVHVGPEESQFTQTRVIRAGGPPEKQINIIFVKAPSGASQQNTEVLLPEPPQAKTLVYVLVKKQESSNNVRVRGPQSPKPQKPEVYFIRYKDQGSVGGPGPGGPGVGPNFGGNNGGGHHGGGPGYGAPPVGGGPNAGY